MHRGRPRPGGRPDDRRSTRGHLPRDPTQSQNTTRRSRSHDVELILTLTGGLTAALVLGFVALRLGLSPIIGYLLAVVVVGPFTPGFAVHAGLSQQLAEIGVVLLMFGVGLQFDVDELLAVRRVALPGALAGMAAGTLGGFAAASLVGWSATSSLVYGLALSISSTVVLVRVLADHGALHTRVGHTAIGWLVVEDVVAVLFLVILPVLTSGGGSAVAITKGVALAFGKVALLIAATVLVGRRVVPRLLVYVARTRARDLFTLTVLVLALGVAVGASKVFGVSMALGAFLAGLLVGQSPFGARAAADAIPMRDAFAVLFFVSVGAMLDPARLRASLPIALLTIAAVLVAKPLVAYLVLRRLGVPRASAAPLAATLAQIGEFSFILVALGRSLGALSDEAAQSLVIASLATITVSPFLFRAARRLPAAPALASGATQPHTLEVAGIAEAGSLVFAATGTSPEPVIQVAKDLNPRLRVLARSHYIRDTPNLRERGADVVVTAEVEVAFAMAERLLSDMGATAVELERARDRVRSELVDAR